MGIDYKGEKLVFSFIGLNIKQVCSCDCICHTEMDLLQALWGVPAKTLTAKSVMGKLCAVLNVNKRCVDRELDVYRNLLSKLVQAKELLKEYVDSMILIL